METRHARGSSFAPASGEVRDVRQSSDNQRRPGGVHDAPREHATHNHLARHGRPGEPERLAGDEQAARIAALLEADIGPDRFARYFGARSSLKLVDGTLEVAAPDRVHSGLLDRRFGDAIRKAARAELGETAEVRFGLAGGAGVAPEPVEEPEAPASPRRAAPVRVQRAARYRLEEYLVSDCNRLAYNAAVRLCGDEHGQAAAGLSPLFIHGPCGVGKTHLLQGLAQRFRERHPGGTVRVTTGEQFMNEFVGALRQGGDGVERFRRQYRRCDLLCIDDVHFLASKSATQEELQHTFDAIDNGGARLVLVCDTHPRQIKKFSPALVSRFQQGMVAQLQPPDAGLREKLVRLFTQRRGLVLDDSGVQALAAKTQSTAGTPPTTVRDIEGLITKLDAVVRLVGEDRTMTGPMNAAAVERALGLGREDPGASGRVPRPVRVEHIISTTCATLGVDVGDLSGKTRHKRVVLARAVITHLARALTTLSYPDIARALGRPSHSTVITAYQRFQGQLAAQESVEDLGLAEVTTMPSLVEMLTAEVRRVAGRAG